MLTNPDNTRSTGKNLATDDLYRGNTLIIRLSSLEFSTGTSTVMIPAGLTTGSDYQIRMGFAWIPNLTSNSPKFTISGASAESLESTISLPARE